MAVVLLGTVGGLFVANRGSSAEAGYRTTTVGAHPVDQELDRVGTVEPVAQASVNFPVDGTVRSVDVTVGDQVTVGQQLARLDTASLDAAVADAQAALDAAELTLERALNGEDVASAGAAPGAATPAGASTTDPNIATLVAYTATAARTDDPELAAAQQAVLDAQRQVDTDLANAQQALDDAKSICASLTAPPDPAAQPDTTSTPDTTGAGVAPSDPDDTDAVAACQNALVAVLDAQHVVADSQNTLADASRALDDLLTQRADNPEPTNPGTGPNTPETGTPPAGQPEPGAPATSIPTTPDAPTGQSPSASPGGGTGTTVASSPTSAELVAYQKAVDAAAAELTVAQQAAAQATLVSPIAGTVQNVDLAVGDTVTAGSSTAAIVVVGGDGSYEVTTTVTVTDLPDLAVGQLVAVTPDGRSEPIEGELVRIGTVGTSSGTATTYPVTIGLTDPPDDLRNGTTASVAIVTADTGDAIAVPTSAITVNNRLATVTVLEDGEPSQATVRTGAVGEVWTEITDGLDIGQTVILADLDEPLPSSATDTQTTGGFGGFGGGRFPGGPTG